MVAAKSAAPRGWIPAATLDTRERRYCYVGRGGILTSIAGTLLDSSSLTSEGLSFLFASIFMGILLNESTLLLPVGMGAFCG